MKEISPVEYRDGVLKLLDQRALPSRLQYVECRTVEELAESIKNLTVRGAPALGVVAAYGMAIAARHGKGRLLPALEEAAATLAATRPTAVNLFWALERMKTKVATLEGFTWEDAVSALEQEAIAIHNQDIAMNKAIARFGSPLIQEGYGILTHCNAGALATGGIGTAVGVLRQAHHDGVTYTAYVSETRPVLQGARLTAWETTQLGINTILITDNMAAHFMARGDIQLVVVGADRIAANGHVANKIGTYGLAVLAKHHSIPFYVAAPTSTVDLSLDNGNEIVIEERDPSEVTAISGQTIAPKGVGVRNPAFDVTPAELISGIITNQGLLKAPYRESLARATGV